MYNKLVIVVAIFILLSACGERKPMGNFILSDATDTTYFDSKNWMLYKDAPSDSKKGEQSGFVDINLFGFRTGTRYLIRDSILYLKDEDKRDIEFLDFRLRNCRAYNTMYGNSIKLLKFYAAPELDDYYYFYLFKMPYSIVDHPEMKDRFIIYASQKKGIIGICDFYQDSTSIKIYNYKGKKELLVDSVFNTPCL